MTKALRFKYWAVQEDLFFNWPQGIRFKIWRKGRRVGATKGAANAIIELMVTTSIAVLWGDTVNANIQKYWERYFEPVLKANSIEYKWSTDQKKLIIGNSYCDFRSEDNPQNWEGFGYNIIFLNEAGIILENSALYTTSVLPMLADNPDSKLIAAGVPKGKKLKNGQEHLFYTLDRRAEQNPSQYMRYHTSSYDSPFPDKPTLRQLEEEIYAMGGNDLVRQEIYGEFIDKSVKSPFIFHFNRTKHVAPVRLDPSKRLYLSLDFNLIPAGGIAYHQWQDEKGFHDHTVDEFKIMNGSIDAMIDEIRMRYYPWLGTMTITGDKMGDKGEFQTRDNASNYTQIKRALNLRDSQIQTPANPTHENSRNQCNYVLYHHPDCKISDKCEGLIYDMENVEIDNTGKIIKLNRNVQAQQADLLDCFRYKVNTHNNDWIKLHQKTSA